MERNRQIHPGRGRDEGEVNLAHEGGQRVTHGNADQDGYGLQHALGETVQQGNDGKDDKAHEQVLPGSEVLRAHAAGEIVGPDGQKADADGDEHGPDHQRWEKALQRPYENAEKELHEPAEKRRAENAAHPIRRAHGFHGGHKGEGRAHDHRQARSYPALAQFQRIGLQKRHQAGHEHGALDHDQAVAGVQPSHYAAENENGGEVAREHGENVLQPDGQGQRETRTPVKLVKKLLALGLDDGTVHAVCSFPFRTVAGVPGLRRDVP